MPRETKEQKAAKAAAAREAESADRERTEAELADIKAAEQELGRPPTKDELSERREARKTADADRALEEEMGGHQSDGDDASPDTPTPSANGNGGGSGSISERAANGAGEGTDGEGEPVFVFEGEQVSLATLLKRVRDIEHHWKFTGKREKGKAALPSLDGDIYLVMRCKPGKYSIVPTRDDEEKTTKAAVEVTVNPKVIHDARGEDGLFLLARLLGDAGWTVEPPVKTDAPQAAAS